MDGNGDSVKDIVAGRATDYVTTLSTDAVSLSDSDSEDLGFPEDAEVATVSPGEEVDEPPLLDSIEAAGLISNRPKTPVQPFQLKGVSSTFNVRSQSIFDCLEGTPKQAAPCPSVAIPEWNFKRPLPPGPLIRSPGEGQARQSRLSGSIPDYLAHPERWTKYSLAEMAESSDKTNTTVAHEFLEDLRKRKAAEDLPAVPEGYIPTFNQDTLSSGAGRILFAKPTKSGEGREGDRGEEEEGQKDKNAKQGLGLEVSKMAAVWGEDDEGEEDVGGKVGHSPPENEGEGKNLGVASADTALAEKEPIPEVGFHSNKKRIRKNLRAKVDTGEDSP